MNKGSLFKWIVVKSNESLVVVLQMLATMLTTQHVAENGRLLSTHCVLACSLSSNTARIRRAAVIFHFAPQHA